MTLNYAVHAIAIGCLLGILGLTWLVLWLIHKVKLLESRLKALEDKPYHTDK